MSLINFAIRTCLQQALLGQTHAEGRVFDSKVTPIDELAEAEPKPLIVVSTDDDQILGDSFALEGKGRELDVVIEMVLAGAVDVTLKDQQGNDVEGIELQIPHTDAGMEITLDFMQRRVMRALAEPGSEWAELFRQFAGTPKKILKRRGASTEKGVKFAARQIVITCEPERNEPAYGRAPNALWSRLIAAMRGDPELTDYADVLAAEITGEALPSWRVLQTMLGWGDGEVRNLGPAPVDPGEIGEPPLLTEATLEADLVRMEAPDAPFANEVRTITSGAQAAFEVPA